MYQCWEWRLSDLWARLGHLGATCLGRIWHSQRGNQRCYSIVSWLGGRETALPMSAELLENRPSFSFLCGCRFKCISDPC